ncbi:TolC family protein [Selenomonas sp. AB3002]|uniref:TolC family protein n=2 Tax=Selenomonas sp. AB3002 TaxID=1392502 RepID=UPI00068F5971
MNKFAFIIAAICSAISFPYHTAAAEAIGLTLTDSIEMALLTDESIEGAEAGREAALHAWKAARRSKGPTVSWNAQALRIGGRDYRSAKKAHSLYGDPHPAQVKVGDVLGALPVYANQTVGSYAYDNTFSNSWSLSVPIYTGGQLENQIKSGRYQLNRADLTVENTRQTVRYQAAEAYANLLHYENLAQVAKDAVDMGHTQLELIRAQFEEGAVAEADMLAMSVSIANYKQNLVNAEKAVEVAKSTLASIVGLPQDTNVEPLDHFSYEPYDKDLPDCEAYALEHRPDGIAADYDIKAAQARKEAAKAGWRPRVTGVGTQSIAGNAPFASERSNNWQAGLSVNWNIFDNGVTSENVRQAASLVDQYEAGARKTRKTIQLETRTAYLNMKAAEQNIQETAVAVKQAEDSYTIAQVRYEEGVDILLSVTNAQEKLTQARSNYMTALYQYNLSRAALEKAMGVPVAFDASVYTEAEQEGASADEALAAAWLGEEE